MFQVILAICWMSSGWWPRLTWLEQVAFRERVELIWSCLYIWCNAATWWIKRGTTLRNFQQHELNTWDGRSNVETERYRGCWGWKVSWPCERGGSVSCCGRKRCRSDGRTWLAVPPPNHNFLWRTQLSNTSTGQLRTSAHAQNPNTKQFIKLILLSANNFPLTRLAC